MRRILRFNGFSIDISKIHNIEGNRIVFEGCSILVEERLATTLNAAVKRQFISEVEGEPHGSYPSFIAFRESLKSGPYLDDNGFVYREKDGVVEMWHVRDL